MTASTSSSKKSTKSADPEAPRAWMVVSNIIMSLGWARVLQSVLQIYLLVSDTTKTSMTDDDMNNKCLELLVPNVKMALLLSFLELINALVGYTRSRPLQVLLFSGVRAFVEFFMAPRLSSCGAWQHIFTVACWSLGDTIRFACFALVVEGGSFPPPAVRRAAKTVRYTVGPLLFPLGAVGEMIMVLAVGSQRGAVIYYFAAALWPFGFVPLFRQLLKQRRKFLAENRVSTEGKPKEKIKAV